MTITSPIELYLRLYEAGDLLLEMALLPPGFDLLDPSPAPGIPEVTLARVIARWPYRGGGMDLVATIGSIKVDGNLLNPYGARGEGARIDGLRFGEAIGKAYLLFTPWGSQEYGVDISDLTPPLTGDLSFAISSSGELMYGLDGTLAIGRYSVVRGGYRNILGRWDYHINMESWFKPFRGVDAGLGLGYTRLPEGREGTNGWIQAYLKEKASLSLNYDGVSRVIQGSVSRRMGRYDLRAIVESNAPLLLQVSRDYPLRIGKGALLSVDAGADIEKTGAVPNLAARLDSTFHLGPLQGVRVYASYASSRYGRYLYLMGEYTAPNGVRGLVTYLSGERTEETNSVPPGLTLSLVRMIEF